MTPELNLEDKARLLSGETSWTTTSAPGVDPILMTDGPHGLRKDVDETGALGESEPATCFPPAVALGASFNPDLARRVGEAIALEAIAQGVDVVLGPGINLKRSPLCGRNFEYFSEDPLVSAIMGGAIVRGLQSRGVGASLKHFAVNNQETDRMRVSADVAERPLRELYLRSFERVIRDEDPWTVMCSYNRLNGTLVSQDPWLLTAVLREEWGYDGLVVSDWGAVDDRVAALKAGLDLQMPTTGGVSDAEVIAAVRSGEIPEELVDRSVDRLRRLVQRTQAQVKEGEFDASAHHALAREVAGECIVLLKNTGSLLPLAPSSQIAVIGRFADEPRYQGAGSSKINPTRVDTALAELRALASRDVVYDDGANAAAVAARAEVAVVFLGLDDAAESEGFDRPHIDLPPEQLEMLDDVLGANPNTVVVLSHGGVVALPFADRVPAIVDASLLGQAGGGAIADVLFGKVNPSARLTETIPLRLADTPSFGNFPGEHGHVSYGEGLLVGYRWFDTKDLGVAFPFGHGLSYTSFTYGEATARMEGDGVVVDVPVTNTGGVDGQEVVQVYVNVPDSRVMRPRRELKGFTLAQISAGQAERVRVEIRASDLAYWDTRVGRWVLESGTYTFEVGASSRDIRSEVSLEIEGEEPLLTLTRDSALGEVLAHPVASVLVAQTIEQLAEQMPQVAGILDDEVMMTLMDSFPVGRLPGYGGLPITIEQIDALLEAANVG